MNVIKIAQDSLHCLGSLPIDARKSPGRHTFRRFHQGGTESA
jgi:hypothetical protein